MIDYEIYTIDNYFSTYLIMDKSSRKTPKPHNMHEMSMEKLDIGMHFLLVGQHLDFCLNYLLDFYFCFMWFFCGNFILCACAYKQLKEFAGINVI